MVSSRKNPDDHVPGSRNLGALHGASYHCTSPAGTGIPDGAFHRGGPQAGFGMWAGIATLTIPLMLLATWITDKIR
jgi:hypothetical protein